MIILFFKELYNNKKAFLTELIVLFVKNLILKITICLEFLFNVVILFVLNVVNL